jgi:hypothetical protein
MSYETPSGILFDSERCLSRHKVCPMEKKITHEWNAWNNHKRRARPNHTTSSAALAA